MATPTASTTTPQRSVPHTGASGLMAYDSPAVLHMLSEGGVGMGITMSGLGMSQLGLTASAMGRADEAERTRRLHSILDTLKQKPGRVSEDGLLTLCRRLGIPWEKTNEAGGYVLLLGDEAMCDIVFHNDQIAKVDLQTGLDGEHPDLRFGQTGSQILVRSLKPLTGQTNINVTLDRFAANLDKLLTLDKLGAPSNGGVSCYNAIAGVYTSLRRLFEHEKNMALTLIDANASNRNHKAERDVMCKKSGRPRLNGGLCLGLSLEYWMDRRHVIPQTDKGKDKMDVDGEDDYPEDDDPETNKMYSLTLECEASPSTLFTPIRISSEWLSTAIEKPADANDANASIDNILLNTPSIDWLDPKPTYLEAPATTGEHDGLNLDSAPGRLPNIRFVARFNPPLVVPLTVYMQLYQSVGLEPRPEDFRPTTFVGLAVRPDELDPGMLGTAGESTHEIRSTRDVVVVDATGQRDVQHNMSLYVPKMEYSRTLESLPFAHPKQIVEILPVLRQYACTTSLLQGSFVDTKNTTTTNNQPPKKPTDTKPNKTKDTHTPLQLDINLSYTPPAPRITLHTPHPASDAAPALPTGDIADLLAELLAAPPAHTHAPLGVTLDVHPNAEIVVAEQNILPVPQIPGDSKGGSAVNGGEAGSGDGDGDAAGADTSADDAMAAAERREQRVKRLARALDVCGDLGVWAEWLRREVGDRGT